MSSSSSDSPQEQAQDESRRDSAASKADSEVSFGNVRVIEHSIQLGDNPAVTDGLPVMMGGKRGSTTVSVDEFEEEVNERGGHHAATKMSAGERLTIISHSHKHSGGSINAAFKEVQEIKHSRNESNHAEEEEKKKHKKHFSLPWHKKKGAKHHK